MASAQKGDITRKSDSIIPPGAVEFFAGTMGGWAQVFSGHPFDTIKVRLQTNSSYSGAMQCLTQTLKNEGISGLYRGVASPLAGIGFCNAVLFTANNEFRNLMLSVRRNGTTVTRVEHLSTVDMAVAGGLAGSVMALLNCPVELLKVKLQTQDQTLKVKQYNGVFDCLVKTFKTSGVNGLYRGFTITLLRDVPSYGAYFGAYELFKHTLAKLNNNVDANGNVKGSVTDMFLAGGFAGIAAWLVCYPQDIIKSRMQMDNKLSNLSAAIAQLNKEARTNGIKVYFRGFAPTIARAFPANAATFLAYEYAKSLF
ncbi:Mitochondrial substrate carrier family protein S [Smittium culicis]|uniref:Mitochondrial substrate carrier family protein S n=2 Tax=Smittium culicis TaxID=133412 RepID=A0A1R1X873_9FUNG|nr:Mitochondrial substrate carrier family protein S [Smittium culicis]OMJ15131.1 Mitochondrial substrate carrier family protein S [Smittium culicis]